MLEWFGIPLSEGMTMPYSRRKRMLLRKQELEEERKRKQQENASSMRGRRGRRGW